MVSCETESEGMGILALKVNDSVAEEVGQHPPVYTPATLAERWQCSEQHIRKMIDAGHITDFRIGTLLRIRGAEVERYENTAALETRK